MRSKLTDVVKAIIILTLIVLTLAYGTFKVSQPSADEKFLNETITTITNPKGEKVNITRKHLLDFIILKTIEEMKQRQSLESGLERNGSR